MYVWVQTELVMLPRLSSISGCHCSTVSFEAVQVRRAASQGQSVCLVLVGVQDLSRLGWWSLKVS